jgi:hypothetical protein
MADEIRLGVEVTVDQAMLDADATLVEKGFKVGDKLTREETDEEVAARKEAEVAASNVTEETPEAKAAREEKEAGDANEAAGLNRDGSSKDQTTSTQDAGIGAPTAANGARHDLA